MFKKTIVAAFVLVAGICSAQAVPWAPKLPFTQAVINYQIDGTEKGTQTVYIKDGGQTTAKHRKTSMKMMGIKHETNTIEVMTADQVISVNLVDKTGTRQANPVKFMIEEYNKLSAADKQKVMSNAEKSGMNMMAGMNGKVTPKAQKIHGFDCDLVEVMGMKNYLINGTGIELKTQSNMMGVKLNVEAKSIDTKAAIPASVFEVPAGIKLETHPQADEMAKNMAKMTIQGLVSGSANMQIKKGQGNQQHQMPQMPQGMPEGLADLQKMMEQMNPGQDDDSGDDED
ncbi:MAG: hypothetical protein PHD82_16165 [Candidatus Riflebacteria bacterium]|nr:hypothetical protein [Candidatus Riflebacteria bacterium]